ncbi:hypothetical protein BOX15_Mlig031502g1, partial [Macrostomum lignano]
QNLEFHDSLVIQCSPECGRYAVAKRPLVKGEILYKELPYCTVLLRHCWPYFCYHCLAPLALATKPQPQSVCCNDCGIRFCDADCCRRASDYHRFECADLDLIESTGIGHLAYRILLTACSSLSPSGASQWLAGAPVPRCFPADYSAVDGLCDNAEHHQLDDVAKYRQVARQLAGVAVSRGLLAGPDRPSDRLTELFASQLLRHVMQLICNAHAILSHYEFNSAENCLTLQLGEQRIASGVYPLTSCLNHSCQPSVASTFSTLTGNCGLLTVRTLTDLAAGKQVYNCYGPHYLRHEWSERRQSLAEQYFFECQCPHCVSRDSGNQRHRALRCPGEACRGTDQPALLTWTGDDLRQEPRLVCLSCRSAFSDPTLLASLASKLDAANSQLTQAALLAEDRPAEALALLRNCQARLTACAHSGNSRLGRCHDLQAKCFSRLGKHRQAAGHAIRSATIVKVQFGGESVEYGKELFKASELLALAGERDRLQQTADICLRLLRLYYGNADSCPLISELEVMLL